MPTWTLSAFADEADPQIDGQIAALKRAGYRHIDLRNVNGHNIAALPLDVAKDVRKKLDDAGITVAMYGSPIGKIDITDDLQQDLDRLRHLGELSGIFGCKAVRLFSFFNKTKLAKGDWQAKSLESMGKLKELALKLGLVLYHENESHIFGDHSDDVLKLAELRDGKSFMLIYDFANYIRTDEAGWDTWQKLKDKTDYFHFKDQKSSGQHMPMGQGDTDATRIMQDVAASGWEGGITLEPHLSFSDAVLATGASGTGAVALKDLPRAETFHIAAEAATKLVQQVGATPA